MGLRPTQGDENGFCPATALHGSVALPFVLPAGVERLSVFVKGERDGLVVEKARTRSAWETLCVSHFPPTLRRLGH
jgi:hypothetical protein